MPCYAVKPRNRSDDGRAAHRADDGLQPMDGHLPDLGTPGRKRTQGGQGKGCGRTGKVRRHHGEKPVPDA